VTGRTQTLGYERYLWHLVTRECEDYQRKRIERLLSQSRIPAEKALSNFRLLVRKTCWFPNVI